MRKNNNQVMRVLFLVTQISITMLTCIFLSIGISYLFDKTFGTSSMVWFIIIGTLAGYRSVYILIKKYVDFSNKNSDEYEELFNRKTDSEADDGINDELDGEDDSDDRP